MTIGVVTVNYAVKVVLLVLAYLMLFVLWRVLFKSTVVIFVLTSSEIVVARF